MYAAYYLKADELNPGLIQQLKNIFHGGEIVILPRDEYAELEKARHNLAYTEKLQNSIREFNEGNVIVKTIAELEAMENE